MTKIRLKYAIPEFGGALYEVKLNLARQEEMTETKGPSKKRPGQPPGKVTEAQRAQRGRFKLAHEYARAALAYPILRAYYEELAAKEEMSPYAMARNDYFKRNDLLPKNK